MAEWLALSTLDHEVLGLHEVDFSSDCIVFHRIEPFIITLPSSRYDINNVERDIKHKIVIIFDVYHSLRMLILNK